MSKVGSEMISEGSHERFDQISLLGGAPFNHASSVKLDTGASQFSNMVFYNQIVHLTLLTYPSVLVLRQQGDHH